jgi:RNA polymerase sigma-70 factor (ECF subfamily)
VSWKLLAAKLMSVDPEHELIARCLRGETGAWDALFLEHYAPAGRFIFQLSPDFTREDAEEITQETFLSVINHLSSFQGNSRLQTWIFRIARNKAQDYRERQMAAKRGGGKETVSLQAENAETGLTIDPPSNDPGPDSRLLQREDNAAVGQALEHLGDACREIIDLRYFADLSYEEIARITGLNIKTVSSRLSKCLDRLEAVLRSNPKGKTSFLPSNLNGMIDGRTKQFESSTKTNAGRKEQER